MMTNPIASVYTFETRARSANADFEATGCTVVVFADANFFNNPVD